jgi:RNA polymerase sigma-70 factor (ECF subfamily)
MSLQNSRSFPEYVSPLRSAVAKAAAQPAADSAEVSHSATLAELCSPHKTKLFQIVYRITRNREDAEDALQDSFLRAFVHLKDFDGRSTFSTWLTRIAINSALMTLRKRANFRSVSLDAPANSEGREIHLQVPDPAPDPERHYVEQERKRMVQDAIRSLRPAQRRVIELQQLEERSMSETADVMGISVVAAKGRLFHAKRTLRKSPKLRSLKKHRGRGPIHSFSNSRTASQVHNYCAVMKSTGTAA